MTFQLAKLGPAETAQILRRLTGPILSFSTTYSFDAEAEATFFSLGGQPWRDPAHCEPPGFFNLLWRDRAILISGYCTCVPEGDSAFTRFELSLSVPHALAEHSDQVTRLVREGLVVFWGGLKPFPSNIEVEISTIDYVAGASPGIAANRDEPVKATVPSGREHPPVRFISDKDQEFSSPPIFVTRMTLEQLQDTEYDKEP